MQNFIFDLLLGVEVALIIIAILSLRWVLDVIMPAMANCIRKG